MNDLERAKEFCIKAHEGQTRKYTGEPYHVHCFEVSQILEDHGYTNDELIAGLLHDTLEDTSVTYRDLVYEFGEYVAELVLEVTDVSRPEDGNRKIRKALDRIHLANASREGQSIKLADLISNCRSIVKHDPKFAKVYMEEKKALLEVLVRGNQYLYNKAEILVNDYYKG